jgi:hypothetical protein
MQGKSASTIAMTVLLLLAVAAAPLIAQQKARPGQKPSSPSQRKPPAKDDDISSSDDPLKLGTELVNVLFSAVDRSNRIVGDLRQRYPSSKTGSRRRSSLSSAKRACR